VQPTGFHFWRLTKKKRGRLLDLRSIGTSFTGVPLAMVTRPELLDRLDFYESTITGDSGNPVFAVIGSELWLYTSFTGSGGGGFGTAVWFQKSMQ